MNILLINQPLNNRGDESAHKALVRNILHTLPNASIIVLFAGSNQDSINRFAVNSERIEYINLKAFKAFSRFSKMGVYYNAPFIWKLHPTCRKIIKFYKNTDIVICAPGGICMGGFQSWTHLFYLKLAQYCSKKLVYYGRSLGPFPEVTTSNRRFKNVSLKMLHYFSFLAVRDAKSEQLLRNFGIKYIHTVDTAFLDSPQTTIPQDVQLILKNKEYMVFVPNALTWHFAYKGIDQNLIIQFYCILINCIEKTFPNLKIAMLPQTFNFSKDKGGGDILFFRKLKDKKKDDNLLIISDEFSSDIQQEIIKNSKFVVGARYHSVVFAINNNRPFIALSYEHKITGLLESLGLEYNMVNIKYIFNNDQSINQAAQEFQKKINKIEEQKIDNKKAKEISTECFLQLMNYLEHSNTEITY